MFVSGLLAVLVEGECPVVAVFFGSEIKWFVHIITIPRQLHIQVHITRHKIIILIPKDKPIPRIPGVPLDDLIDRIRVPFLGLLIPRLQETIIP